MEAKCANSVGFFADVEAFQIRERMKLLIKKKINNMLPEEIMFTYLKRIIFCSICNSK